MTHKITNTPIALVILDGWGERDEQENNGIALANKPFFDHLKKNFPWTKIAASEEAVGLPHGVMGNSEVGHMNIGAGRVVYSGLSQIFRSIEDKSFFKNAELLRAMQQVKKCQSTLHLMGLLSDGSVHSHEGHLWALLEMAKEQNVRQVAIHCFMDGRDTAPNDGIKYLQRLENEMKRLGVGRIASISGRFFAMDRDQRWERTARAFSALCGTGEPAVDEPQKYLQECYARGEGDEFIPPVRVLDENHQSSKMSADDAVIFFNFRADRARQISRALTDHHFKELDQGIAVLPAVFVCMTPYDSSLKLPVAFEPSYPQNILGEILAEKGLKQLRLAETEKYAHVTFFFNGGRDVVFQGEERILVNSPKEVATYDLKPEMSAFAVRDQCLAALQTEKYDVIIINFANADMVGHTAKPQPIIRAVEAVDQCLSAIIPEILRRGGTALITADHGNAECMVDANGEPMTAHTIDLVPFIVVSEKLQGASLREGGRLCDIAPTILKILQIPKPEEMTGESIL